MLNTAEDMQAFLSARRYLYMLFQSLLGNEPTEELLAAIDLDFAREAFAEIGMVQTDSVARLFSSLGELSSDDLKSEYTRLFIGPEELKAAPWESVFVSGDGTLFTAETLTVRKFYKAQGFIPAEYPHVADDHIAIELDFMAKLAARALEDHNSDEGKVALEASEKFLQEHLLEWVPLYLDKAKETHALFYPILVEVLYDYLKEDASAIKTLL